MFDHKEYILNNKYSLTPLKRVRTYRDIELGFILPTDITIVYLGNIYDMKNLKAMSKIQYKSVDELLGDGWVVD